MLAKSSLNQHFSGPAHGGDDPAAVVNSLDDGDGSLTQKIRLSFVGVLATALTNTSEDCHNIEPIKVSVFEVLHQNLRTDTHAAHTVDFFQNRNRCDYGLNRSE